MLNTRFPGYRSDLLLADMAVHVKQKFTFVTRPL